LFTVDRDAIHQTSIHPDFLFINLISMHRAFATFFGFGCVIDDVSFLTKQENFSQLERGRLAREASQRQTTNR
jgi:hypothetical protein